MEADCALRGCLSAAQISEQLRTSSTVNGNLSLNGENAKQFLTMHHDNINNINSINFNNNDHDMLFDKLLENLSFASVNSDSNDTANFVVDGPYKINFTDLIFVVLFCLLIIIVIIGNTLVILSVLTTRRLRTVTNLFVTSLAVADWLVGIFVMPPAVAYYLMGELNFNENFPRISRSPSARESLNKLFH